MNRSPAGFLVVTLTALGLACTPDVEGEVAGDHAALATPPSTLERATSYIRNPKFGLGTTGAGRAREWQYDLSPPAWKLKHGSHRQGRALGCVDPEPSDQRCWLGQELELPVHIADRGSQFEVRFKAKRGVTGAIRVRVRDLDNDEVVEVWDVTPPPGWSEHVLTGTLPAGSRRFRLAFRAPRQTLLDDVAFAVEESIEQDGMCAASASSPVGDAIDSALAAYVPSGSPITRKTLCNTLAGDAWISTPPVDSTANPGGLIAGQEEFFHRAQDLIRATKSRLQIVTLTFDELTLDYIASALRDLHDSQTGEQGPYPFVQLMQSNPMLAWGLEPSEILEQIAEAMHPIPDDEWRFYLAIRSVSKQGPLDSFSHTKIVLRDREEAIAGGHNFDGYALTSDPIHHDASLHVSGDAARVAGDMFDALWARSLIDGEPDVDRCARTDNFGNVHDADGKHFACSPSSTRVETSEIAFTNHIPPLPPSGVHGALPIHGLGRGVIAVPGAEGLELADDWSADAAIMGAIDSATSSIRLLQHSLKNVVVPWDDPPPQMLEEALWRAIFERGVSVEVVVSDLWGPTPSGPQHVVDALYEGAGAFAVAHYPSDFPTEEDALAELDCLLRVVHFRAPGWSAVGQRNHAKVILIDDTAVYVGSQNLYRNELLDTLDGSDPGLQLADFGYFVDDAAFAQETKAAIWDVVWAASEPTRVVPPGRGAATIDPATGACIPECVDPAAPWYNPDTGVCEPCPAETPIWSEEEGLCFGGCPGGTAAGGDAGVVRAFELGQPAGTFQFSWEHYGVMDRSIVRYEGLTLYDTGCTGGSSTVDLTYDGAETFVVVEVVPNCAGTSGTAWNFSVSCPLAP